MSGNFGGTGSLNSNFLSQTQSQKLKMLKIISQQQHNLINFSKTLKSYQGESLQSSERKAEKQSSLMQEDNEGILSARLDDLAD
jgi:SAM-dependent MidA family methyltransferase